MKILDRIPSYSTHKFGVIYVGRGQEKSEIDILSNEFGSTRYTDFIAGLGDLIKLTECSANGCFTAGMDRTGADGKFAYIWKDDTTQGKEPERLKKRFFTLLLFVSYTLLPIALPLEFAN